MQREVRSANAPNVLSAATIPSMDLTQFQIADVWLGSTATHPPVPPVPPPQALSDPATVLPAQSPLCISQKMRFMRWTATSTPDTSEMPHQHSTTCTAGFELISERHVPSQTGEYGLWEARVEATS